MHILSQIQHNVSGSMVKHKGKIQITFPLSTPFSPGSASLLHSQLLYPAVVQHALLFLCCKFEASTSECSLLGTRPVGAPVFTGSEMSTECRRCCLRVGLLPGFFRVTFQRLPDNGDLTDLQFLLKQSKPQQPFTKLK